ncbi:WcaG Nucleoside-diphosphate-sugar epimerases [Candidatus Pelagibacterales bacterium]
MKVLILGSNGRIGKDLVNLFLKKNYVYSIQRNKLIDHVKKIYQKNKKPILLIKKKLISIDLIINAIATHEFSRKKNYRDFYNSNVKIVNQITKFYENQKNGKLIVNLSSVNANKFYLNKSINKNNRFTKLYSKTKLMGEKIISKCKRNYLNLRMPGVICFKIDKQRPWFGKIIFKIKNNLNIKINNYERNFNGFIDSYEIFLIIKKFMKKKIVRGTYNLSPINPLPIKYLIGLIKNKYKSNSKIINEGNNKNLFLISNKKIISDYNIYPSSVEKILKRILNKC